MPAHKKYDWDEVQRKFDELNSVRGTIRFFGMSNKTWDSARKKGWIRPYDTRIPIDELCSLGARRSRTHVKARLLQAGLLATKCYVCEIENWLGKPLSLQLDHINGDGRDWRVENLRLLCPNCHSQTENWGSRNWKRRNTELG